MRKIIIVAPDFYPVSAGYSNVIQALVKTLAESRRFQIVVIVAKPLPEGKSEFVSNNVEVKRPPKWIEKGAVIYFLTEWSLGRLVCQTADEFEPEAILFETAEYPFALLRTLSSTRHRKKVWIRVHASAETEWALYYDHPIYRFKRRWIKKAFQRVPHLLSTNSYHLRFVCERFLDGNPFVIGPKTLGVLPNITLSAETQIEPSAISALDPLVEKHPNFLLLGRMTHPGFTEKNFLRVLEAFYRLRNEPWFDHSQIICIGSGPGQVALQKLATHLGLAKQIKWFESLANPQVQYLQKKVDFAILASLHEGLSSFGLECLKNGAGLLMSRDTGVESLVREGKNGYLFDSKSVDSIAHAIRRAALNLTHSANVSSESRAHFEALFSPSVVVESFDELLNFSTQRNNQTFPGDSN